MNRAEKRLQVIQQIERMTEEFKKSVLDKVDAALMSSSVPEDFKTEDNALLAMSLVDSAMRLRPFSPTS